MLQRSVATYGAIHKPLLISCCALETEVFERGQKTEIYRIVTYTVQSNLSLRGQFNHFFGGGAVSFFESHQ